MLLIPKLHGYSEDSAVTSLCWITTNYQEIFLNFLVYSIRREAYIKIHAWQRYVPVGNWYPAFLLNCVQLGQAVLALLLPNPRISLWGQGTTQSIGLGDLDRMKVVVWWTQSILTLPQQPALTGHQEHMVWAPKFSPPSPSKSPRAAVLQALPWSLILQDLHRAGTRASVALSEPPGTAACQTFLFSLFTTSIPLRLLFAACRPSEKRLQEESG